MTDIIVKPDKPAEVYFPSKMIWPRSGEITLRCGNCQSYNFKVHIKATKFKQARMTELVCTVCLKWYTVNDKSMLEGGGNIKTKGPAKKMNGSK